MVDAARKKRGTEVEWQCTYIFQDHGFMVEPHQTNRDKSFRSEAAMAMLPEEPYGSGRKLVMPDLTCWRDGYGFQVEVKSKYPTPYGEYGLDCNRFNYLQRYQNMTGLPALYVIYDTALSGGRLDDRSAFLVATVDDLDQTKERGGTFYFWPTSAFEPLVPFLAALQPEGIIRPSIIPPRGDTIPATLH